MFKRMKLAPKLAIVIGASLAVIFVILIGLTASMSGAAINSAVSGELTALSKSNGQQIQQIFDTASTVAEDIQNFLERSYRMAETTPALNQMPTTEEAARMNQSEIYGRPLTSINYDVELYMRETARNTAAHNEDITGVGVMFEPYAFQEDIRDYAFYIDAANADADAKPFGAYQTYSVEDYYKEAAVAQKAIVTEPYEYNGIQMVSYATPILHNGALQGVVLADINVSHFDKVDSTSERYPSMYATIYDNNQKIIYDSEDPADIGHNMSEFMAKSEEMDAVKSSMAQGQAFQIATTREDGRKVIRFFTPIQAGSETWWSLTALDEADVNEATTQTVKWMLILSAAALLLLILITVFLLRFMLKPLQPVVQAAEQIAQGNLDVQLSTNGHDEIGILSTSFMKMASTLKTMVTDVDYLLDSMADGNFNIDTRAEESYVGAFHGFLLSMRKMNRRLSEALSQINMSADQVSAGSEPTFWR